MSKVYQKHVVWLDIPMNESHGMNRVQGQDQLRRVEPGPLLGNVVVGHQVHKIATFEYLCKTL